jgi:hypothetical protein
VLKGDYALRVGKLHGIAPLQFAGPTVPGSLTEVAQDGADQKAEGMD